MADVKQTSNQQSGERKAPVVVNTPTPTVANVKPQDVVGSATTNSSTLAIIAPVKVYTADPLVVATLLAGYITRWGAIQVKDIPSRVADVVLVAREIEKQLTATGN